MRDLEELLNVYLQYQKDVNSSVHTIERTRSGVKLFLTWLAEADTVNSAAELHAGHLHRYQRHLAAYVTARGIPLKPSSLNSRVKSVRSFLDFLCRRRLIAVQLSHELKYVKEDRLLPVSVLSHAQVQKVFQVIGTNTETGIRDRAVVELLYSTGVRISELESLDLEDIDLNTASLKVVGKGRKERFLPIGRTALKWLISYIRAVRPFLIQESSTRAVFLNSRGRRWRQGSIRSAIHRYAEAAGLQITVTPHTFRRSCATEMIKDNANIYHVKELLGHETLETLKHYAKLDISDLRKTLSEHHPREKDS